MRHVFEKSLSLPCSAAQAFAWHERPDALGELIPPNDPVRVIEHQPGKQGSIGDGARVVLAIGKWPFQIRWVAVHEGYVAGQQFVDKQVRGPFAFWRHTHSFEATGERSCMLKDHVEYRLPLGLFGSILAHGLVRKKIERMFVWRHAVTARELNQ